MDWIYAVIGVTGLGALFLLYRIFKDVTKAFGDVAQSKQEALRAEEKANRAEEALERAKQAKDVRGADLDDKWLRPRD